MPDSYKMLLAKKEATYNIDAVPTSAANAILTRGFEYEPLVFDMLNRNLDIAARGALPGVPTNKRATFAFEFELQGSGAAGTAPPWMPLLEACGMAAPVLTATVSAAQRMAAINTAISSLSAYWWAGDQAHKALGCRGDITSIDFTAGAYPFIGVDFMGLVPAAAWSVSAPPVPVLTAWREPIEFTTAASSFALNGFAAVLKSFKAKVNADVKLRNLVGTNYIQRGNHAMDVSILIEAPSFAAMNYLNTLNAGARIPVSITHGTVAGSIIQLDAPFLQFKKIKPVNDDDILMYQIDADMTINLGQDDITITAR